MIVRSWTSSQRRELFHVTVAGRPSASTEAETKSAIEAGFEALRKAGLEPDQVVRSRIWARDAEARRQASDARRTALVGSRRGASASFVDSARLPEHSTMMIDLVALRTRTRTGSKIIGEYEPPAAPPEFVALDGMVFLSGNTDNSPGFEEQLIRVRGKIEKGLRNAGAPWSKIVQVLAFVSNGVDQNSALRQLAPHFGNLPCPLLTTAVAGFSSPEKLIEMEVTADLSGN